MQNDFPGIFTYISEAAAGRMTSTSDADDLRREAAELRGEVVRSKLHKDQLEAMRRDHIPHQTAVGQSGFEIDLFARRFIANGETAHLALMRALDKIEAAGASYVPPVRVPSPHWHPASAPSASQTLLPSQQSPFTAIASHLLPAYADMSLAAAFDDHIGMERLRKIITEQTISEKRNVFEDVLALLGKAIQLNTVTRYMISNNWTRAELARKSRKNPNEILSLSRVNKRYGYLKKFFSWAIDSALYHGENPCVKPPAEKRDADSAKVSWRPFTEEELVTLFSPAYVQFASKPDWYWLPLIALFSGARLSEVGNLGVADFQIRDGIKLFFIKAGKTVSSRRVVPIHSQLLSLGLWEYVAYLKSQEATRLFPHRSLNKPSKSVGRMWGLWVQECGIEDPHKVFHSFRSTVITKLRGFTEDVNPVAVMRTVGHSTSTVTGPHGSYIVGADLKVLHKTVEQIVYSFLDFGPLRLPDPTFSSFFGGEGTFVQDTTKMSIGSVRRINNQAARAERLGRLAKSRTSKK